VKELLPVMKKCGVPETSQTDESVSMKNSISLTTNLDEKYNSSTSGLKMIECRLKKLHQKEYGNHFYTLLEGHLYHFVEDLELQFKFNLPQLLGVH